MARLYADEDFSYPRVVELRRLGHDVLTAPKAGEGGQQRTDIEVLAFPDIFAESSQDYWPIPTGPRRGPRPASPANSFQLQRKQLALRGTILIQRAHQVFKRVLLLLLVHRLRR